MAIISKETDVCTKRPIKEEMCPKRPLGADGRGAEVWNLCQKRPIYIQRDL